MVAARDLPPRTFLRRDGESAQPAGADDMRKIRFTEAQIIGMFKGTWLGDVSTCP
jgi:hypothetical protein